MSVRLYMNGEPTVIDDVLLHAVILEQGPKGHQAKTLFEEEGIEYGKILSLKIEYRNVLKIENLWQFKAVKKLQLSNNIIEKIEGLADLINLTWLDLSFNRIEVIEGLENLVNIRDLSLYSNKISTLENLDNLKKLQVFSVGSNNIEDISNVIYLRCLKSLQCLNLSGNPLSETEDYKLQVVAYLPHLKYLDYKLINDILRVQANEKYKYEIEKMTVLAKIQEEKELQIAHDEEKNTLYKSAFVDNLNESILFKEIFADDEDGHLLQSLPGTEDAFEHFKECFLELCHDIVQRGLTEHNQRREEITTFIACTEEARMNNRTIAIKEVNQFLQYKEKIFQTVLSMDTESEDPVVAETLNNITSEFGTESTTLWNTLMGLEMQLVDQLEDIHQEFQTQMTAMANNFVSEVHSLFAQLIELDGQFMNEVKKVVINCQEKEEKEDVEHNDIEEPLKDEEMLEKAMKTSHEKHVAVIDRKKELLVSRLRSWISELLEKLRAKEQERNRQRVMEINHFIDALRDELDDICGFPAVVELPL